MKRDAFANSGSRERDPSLWETVSHSEPAAAGRQRAMAPIRSPTCLVI